MIDEPVNDETTGVGWKMEGSGDRNQLKDPTQQMSSAGRAENYEWDQVGLREAGASSRWFGDVT